MANVNDVVLIHFEEQPLSFARIEEIIPDAKRGWFHVKLLLLQLPLRAVTWILREAYIDGEVFTMGGNRIRLEAVVCPDENAPADDSNLPTAQAPQEAAVGERVSSGKVISLASARKKQ